MFQCALVNRSVGSTLRRTYALNPHPVARHPMPTTRCPPSNAHHHMPTTPPHALSLRQAARWATHSHTHTRRFFSSSSTIHDRTPRRRARPSTKVGAATAAGSAATGGAPRTHRKRKSVGGSQKPGKGKDDEGDKDDKSKDDTHVLAHSSLKSLFAVPDGLGIHGMALAVAGGLLLAAAAFFSGHEFLDQPPMAAALERVAAMEAATRLKFVGVTVAGLTFWPLCSELNRLYLCRLALKSGALMRMAPLHANAAAFTLSLFFLSALRFLSGYDLSIGGFYIDNACSFGLLYFGNFWVPLTWHVVGKSLLSLLWLDNEVDKFERTQKQANETDK